MTPDDRKAADLALARKHAPNERDGEYTFGDEAILAAFAAVREQAKAEVLDAAAKRYANMAAREGNYYTAQRYEDYSSAILALKDKTP